MKTIALLTDFGLRDNFIGVMKAVILKVNPCVNIVDISHSIEPQDISGASFLLKGSYKYFPKGTIFVVVVDPGVGSRRHPIIIQSRNYFFIGPDNGVLSFAANDDRIKKIVVIENRRYFLKPVSDTFHGRDIFAPVAAYLSKGKELHSFGRRLISMKRVVMPVPKEKRGTLKGKVIYIDKFGNLVTNIDKRLFQQFTQKAHFRIKIKDKTLNSIAEFYQTVNPGKVLAIFDSFGLLEISINRGSAERRLKAKKGTTISITQ